MSEYSPEISHVYINNSSTPDIQESTKESIKESNKESINDYSTEEITETKSSSNINTVSNSVSDKEIETSIVSTSIISTTENQKENLDYSTSISEIDNKNKIEIFILQTRLLNKLLKIFLIIFDKIDNFSKIQIIIDIYKNTNLRNLQESSPTSQTIDLYLDSQNENDEIEPGKILILTSQKEFENSDRIVINPNKNQNLEIKVLNNDNKILDTLENEKMIRNGEMVDFFYNGVSDFKINQYIISSSSIGCNFNLFSNKIIEEKNKQNITLNFIENNNNNDNNNNIKAECIISNETENKIPCYLGEEVDKNFILDSYIGIQEKNIFFISQENKAKNFLLTCLNEKEKDSNTVVTIVVIIIIVIFIAIVILLVKFRKKEERKEPDIKNINPKDDEFFFYVDNNVETKSNRSSEKDRETSFSLYGKKRKKKEKNIIKWLF